MHFTFQLVSRLFRYASRNSTGCVQGIRREMGVCPRRTAGLATLPRLGSGVTGKRTRKLFCTPTGPSAWCKESRRVPSACVRYFGQGQHVVRLRTERLNGDPVFVTGTTCVRRHGDFRMIMVHICVHEYWGCQGAYLRHVKIMYSNFSTVKTIR